ncbi:hypothetical protein I302_108891 [Kwoniella bestiolae CBS 10118]|uniref:Uncharacterized protein n=1 Tax=Kwoniella bestiolae CBS 10118 TaxID=1296100 RepID=A0A1B9FUD8_9TREE|nr:hypothetical protein I302_08028 [Kwoniella bestiolae CBS 10118]OCF22381.1 hypothetical protein I302_08028 [Kwoniella bestiolae CBS 10118]
MSNNNVEDEDDLTCLPPDLDTSDRIACDKFYDIANDEQKRALDALSIQRITDTIKSISRECRKMNKKFDNLIRYSASVQGVRAGQPISFQVEVDGKKFPDDMPEKTRNSPCLPPDLDLQDHKACRAFYKQHANKEQRKALNIASMYRMIKSSDSLNNNLCKLNEKLKGYMNYNNSIALVPAGGPLEYEVEVDEKKYPDDMPEVCQVDLLHWGRS